MLVETHLGGHRSLLTQMIRLYAASERAGAARCPGELKWNPVRFRLALRGMMNALQGTTISKRPDTGGKGKPYRVLKLLVLHIRDSHLLEFLMFLLNRKPNTRCIHGVVVPTCTGTWDQMAGRVIKEILFICWPRRY